MKLTLINAKTDLGVMVDGANLGPEILSNYYKDDKRIDKIINLEKENIKKSHDPKDLAKNLDAINEFNARLYNEIKQDNNFPITLGGDHSLAIGSALAAIKKKEKLGIIWIDSHGDYNTFETTRTGNIHGLPLAALNHQTGDRLSLFHDGNYYLPENTVIVGGRDIDPWEMPVIEKAGATVFSTKDIKEQGIDVIIKKAIDIASNNTKGIHISFDIDVIDPEIAKGVSVPAINGITDEEAYLITDEVLKYKDKIKSWDLVEFNPLKDEDKKTEKIAINILEKVISNIK